MKYIWYTPLYTFDSVAFSPRHSQQPWIHVVPPNRGERGCQVGSRPRSRRKEKLGRWEKLSYIYIYMYTHGYSMILCFVILQFIMLPLCYSSVMLCYVVFYHFFVLTSFPQFSAMENNHQKQKSVSPVTTKDRPCSMNMLNMDN